VLRARYRLVVRGMVQGVWYRDSCRSEARRLGVNGWVRNRGDGAVEVVVEGDAEAADRLVQWCRHGPRSAVVTAVDVVEEPPQGETGFRVR
jgi:acylphosphatase